MIINRIGLAPILSDNDVQYITYITRVIHKSDDKAEVTIIRGVRTYSYNIIPSDPVLKVGIIDSLKIAHQVLGIAIQFSKTMDISSAIHFELI